MERWNAENDMSRMRARIGTLFRLFHRSTFRISKRNQRLIWNNGVSTIVPLSRYQKEFKDLSGTMGSNRAGMLGAAARETNRMMMQSHMWEWSR